MPNEIIVIRDGECVGCAMCCGFPDNPCSHLTENRKCSVYDERNKYCEEHEADHKSCIEFPRLSDFDTQKWKDCGYRFYLGDDEIFMVKTRPRLTPDGLHRWHERRKKQTWMDKE